MPDKERSISTVLEDIVANVQGIIRSEVRLAKTEIREEAAKAGKGAGTLGAGAVVSLFALGFLFLAGLRGLEIVVAPWQAALIMMVVAGTAAAIVIKTGIKRIKSVDPKPEKTIHTIKENLEWVKHHIR